MPPGEDGVGVSCYCLASAGAAAASCGGIVKIDRHGQPQATSWREDGRLGKGQQNRAFGRPKIQISSFLQRNQY